jgi:hypothetical protein
MHLDRFRHGASGKSADHRTDDDRADARDQAICDPLAVSLHEVLEGQGAAVGPIRVRAVDALERRSTGKAPLILGSHRRA